MLRQQNNDLNLQLNRVSHIVIRIVYLTSACFLPSSFTFWPMSGVCWYPGGILIGVKGMLVPWLVSEVCKNWPTEAFTRYFIQNKWHDRTIKLSSLSFSLCSRTTSPFKYDSVSNPWLNRVTKWTNKSTAPRKLFLNHKFHHIMVKLGILDPGALPGSRGTPWIQGHSLDPGALPGSRGTPWIQGHSLDPGALPGWFWKLDHLVLHGWHY